MRETIIVKRIQLKENEYCDLINNLVSKKYVPIIDPRRFDSPISIKARFKVSNTSIRFIEVSPALEISMEHSMPKTEAKSELKVLSGQIESIVNTGNVKPEDFEVATLQMISRRNPVIVPKNDAEKKLFKSLEDKKIFSKASPVRCPKCEQTFMFSSKELKLEDERAFCVDCGSWFPVKIGKEVYIINEEYMEVMGGVWDKVQKLIKKSWYEVMKRGLPVLSHEKHNKNKSSE